ncbi:hypothetical protein EV561_12027 [Rhizobium sp. BK376]|nr:hypothetical protein EV561_12027 [Rhizobium sp. BK376]
MSATACAILAAFAIFLFLRFQLDVRWMIYGLMALAGVAAWAFCESLEERRTDDED